MGAFLRGTGVTYDKVILQILRSGSHRKTREVLLEYFHPSERANVAVALDALVKLGSVDFDGSVYSLSRSK